MDNKMKQNKSCGNLRLPHSLSPSPEMKWRRQRRVSHHINSEGSNSIALRSNSAEVKTAKISTDFEQGTLFEIQTDTKKSTSNDSKNHLSVTNHHKSTSMPTVLSSVHTVMSSTENSDVHPSTARNSYTKISTSNTDLVRSHQTETHISESINASTKSSNTSNSRKLSNKSNDLSDTNSPNLLERKHKLPYSSRQKKFHRHFYQVDADEDVINYFACAFVSEILLQGYLYITKNYFAFYSNVFGYVTKLLIPVRSVIKISKEKTVKIIPNAIAVATDGERYVFSSFLSRENAYQLMISLWKDHMPCDEIERASSSVYLRSRFNSISSDSKTTEKPTKSQDREKQGLTPKKHTLEVGRWRQGGSSHDNDASEMDDESSSAFSGNESLRQITQSPQSEISDSENVATLTRDAQLYDPSRGDSNLESIRNASSNSTHDSTVNTIPAPFVPAPIDDDTQQNTILIYNFRIPRDIHIVYFGLAIAVILAVFATFCFYQINQLQKLQQTKKFAVDGLNEVFPDTVEGFSELLKWQKEMQSERLSLSRNILKNKLDQVVNIGNELDTLSLLMKTGKDSTETVQCTSSDAVLNCDISESYLENTSN